MILIGAMALGVVQIITGMVISFVEKCKAGDVFGAVFEEGYPDWYERRIIKKERRGRWTVKRDPVSYTHLDVYKRQSVTFTIGGCTGLLTKFG